MTLRPRRAIVAMVLAASALLWCWALPALASGDHTATAPGGDAPESFASAVRMIRDAMGGIDSSRTSHDFIGLAHRASRLAVLAAQTPPLADVSVPNSARAEVTRACERMAVVAGELRSAAARHDTAGVTLQASRFGELLLALDAHVAKQYVCPMHCETGKTYDRPGFCPVCGMRLQLVTSDRYSVEVRPASGAIRSGVPTQLTFLVKDPAGFEVDHFEVVHEKLLHLMMVSEDLSWFAHVHPVRERGGHFRQRCTFPAGGTYVLFHDFTPGDVGMQVVPVEITVAGPRRPLTPLVADDDRPKRIDGYVVSLAHTGLALGAECALTFTLTRHGKPVLDLEPFLGTMGHLVMISEDRAAFIHSHPLERTAATGPRVQFNMVFSRTGLYKAWGQFQRHGRVITAPFVLEVSIDGHSHRTGSGAPKVAR